MPKTMSGIAFEDFDRYLPKRKHKLFLCPKKKSSQYWDKCLKICWKDRKVFTISSINYDFVYKNM